MGEYRIVQRSIDETKKNVKIGSIICIQGAGECLVVGFSSVTGVPIVYSYELQTFIGVP